MAALQNSAVSWNGPRHGHSQRIIAALASVNPNTWIIYLRVVIFALMVHGLPHAQSTRVLVLNGLFCAEGVFALLIKCQLHLARPFVRLTGSVHLRISHQGVSQEEIAFKCSCEMAERRDGKSHPEGGRANAPSVEQPKKSEIFSKAISGELPMHSLEKIAEDHTAAVEIRRAVVSRSGVISRLPYAGYDFTAVYGRCAENVIGYMLIPVGVAGPLVLDEVSYFVPMATTEGAFIASTCRGIKAINGKGGACAVLKDDGMTRTPCLHFPTLRQAFAANVSDHQMHAITRCTVAPKSTPRTKN